MQVGILADSHDQLERTQRAIGLLQASGAQALIHCGDLATPEIVKACSVLPFYFVFGNHDADSVPYLLQAAEESGATCLKWGGIVELAGKRIGVAHGHLTSDLKRVLSATPDYLLTGHSHFSVDSLEDGVRRINPGALYRASIFTVALLDVVTGQLQFLTVPR
ncbi:MAG: phosphodiesterase [Planctomycetaceae bacterium]|nr:phosphodiesterase [Planctomycetaceae bacterium]